MRTRLVILLLVVFFITACGSTLPTVDTEATVQAAVSATLAARPTDTPPPKPTDTPEPTSTSTIAPTDTPEPTNTPRPTSTPSPEPSFKPIEINGNGSDVVDIKKEMYPAVVLISGNARSGFFAVKSFNNNGDENLLVNTTEPYVGIRPIDFLDGEITKRFQVEAEGEWLITVFPLSDVDRITVPGELKGEGDNVLLVNGNPDTALISGNDSAGFFAVMAYTTNGKDLLVNTTDPYNGRVIVSPETIVLEIQATGPWLISLE